MSELSSSKQDRSTRSDRGWSDHVERILRRSALRPNQVNPRDQDGTYNFCVSARTLRHVAYSSPSCFYPRPARLRRTLARGAQMLSSHPAGKDAGDGDTHRAGAQYVKDNFCLSPSQRLIDHHPTKL